MKMPSYNIKHTFAQPVAMEVTSAQLKALVYPMQELGYQVEPFAEGGLIVTNVMSRHFLCCSCSDYMEAREGRYLVEPVNWRLFLAIAAMTTGENFIAGEYGVALGDIGGDKIKEGEIRCMRAVSGPGVEIAGIGWARGDAFRKATLEEIEKYFSLKQIN